NNRTGPSGAYQGNWYMYAQGKGNNGNAILEAPCFDIRNLTNPVVNFAYSMNGTQVGTLRLEVSTNNGATWTSLWSLSGDQGTGSGWKTASLSLNNYKTAFTRIRFFAIAGGNFGDMAIDGIEVKGETTNPCTGPTLSFSKTDVSCFGGSNGSASVSVTNATAPFTYLWSDGAIASSISNKPAGTYSVTVTATGGCTATGSVVIGQPGQMNLNLQPSPTSAPGASDGSIALTVSGGTSPYGYAWGHGPTTKDVQGLSANTYNVNVLDAKGCPGQGSATVVDGEDPGTCDNIMTLSHTESFEGSYPDWAQATNDQFDWTRNSGGTPTNNTGPTGAAQGQYYMYTEANDASPGSSAILISSCIDLSSISNASIQFAWHMNGNQMGSLVLQISDDNGNTWTNLWSRSGHNGTNWMNQTNSLASYAGKVVRLRFVGTLSNGPRGDMGIDNIRILTTGGSPEMVTGITPGQFGLQNVYPNPTSGQVQVQVYAQEATMARFSLLDVAGRSSELGQVPLSAGMNTVRLSLPGQHDGIYLLRLQENGRVHTRSIMIKK
ncbi:MAG TPA: choice-of-anchor J domain-containing protein, partial [Anaerolineae bacterium]|nr:choice-of-anchor J domain-containing protein [Anaerolineae bacterium]